MWSSSRIARTCNSNWMENAELFVHVMLHFIKQSRVTVLTLHPHTTAKMQPLNVGINDPFKVYYNSAVESWLLKNPGKPITIYNVADCVGQAYTKSITPINIASAFKKCGIFPYDADIFTEIDFMPSWVTDRDQADCKIVKILLVPHQM